MCAKRKWSRLLVLVGLLGGAMPGAAQTPAPAASRIVKAGELVDLNTASAAQLEALPGMGKAYARRIIEGRPYLTKNQLLSRGVVPQATYDKLKDSVVARRQPK